MLAAVIADGISNAVYLEQLAKPGVLAEFTPHQ